MKVLAPPCIHETLYLPEFGSNWFSFSFSSSGLFYFTITPSELLRDLDFVVFLAPDHSCDEYLPVRCMASGESIGSPIDSICLGPTGLSPSSTDFYELAGCGLTHDNFLAPLSVIPGESYYLMVIDFTQSSDSSYNIEFNSTAKFNCATSVLNAVDDSKINIQILPNPVIDEVEIVLSKHPQVELLIQVVDMYGRICNENAIPMNGQIIINTIDLTSAVYLIRVLSKNELIGAIPFVHQ